MIPVQKCLPLVRRGLNIQPVRSVVSGPPTQRVALPLKVAHCAAIAVSFLVIPVWVTIHIRSYRK